MKKYQGLLSSRLGDGGFIRNGVNYSVQFVSKFRDYLEFKRNLFISYGLPIRDNNITKLYSGYKEGAFSYQFYTRNSSIITEVALMTKIDVINYLNLEGLIMYYLEDGSFHQKKRFSHLYCNTFNPQEVNALIEKIYSIYPVKPPTLRWDRKRDGREFPYLYLPVPTTNELCEDTLNFLESNNIESLKYKVGISPSTTIENTNK